MPTHPFNNGELVIRDERLAPWPRTPDIVRQHTADYYGMITHMDHQIGLILNTLKETGLDKNTIIVFASDHGLAVGRHGLLGKQNLYEHSMRAPLIFVGPNVPAGKSSDALTYLLDIFPTVCDLAKVPAPETVEGQSLAPIIAGAEAPVRRAVFLAYKDIQRAIVTKRWKLIRYPKINKTQLFDLTEDPHELKDLSADEAHAMRVTRLTQRLTRMQARLDDKTPLTVDNPQSPDFDFSKVK